MLTRNLPTTPHALPALSGDVVPLAHCRARARRTLLSLYAARTCRDPPTATSQAGGASRGGTSSGCANGATRATSSGRDTAGALDDGADFPTNETCHIDCPPGPQRACDFHVLHRSAELRLGVRNGDQATGIWLHGAVEFVVKDILQLRDDFLFKIAEVSS